MTTDTRLTPRQATPPADEVAALIRDLANYIRTLPVATLKERARRVELLERAERALGEGRA